MLDPEDHATHRYLQQQSAPDPDTVARLNKIRAEAVALSEHAPERWILLGWLPRAGYAAAFSLAIVAAMLLLQPAQVTDTPDALPLDLVLLSDDFELLEQELAFYDWMASQG